MAKSEMKFIVAGMTLYAAAVVLASTVVADRKLVHELENTKVRFPEKPTPYLVLEEAVASPYQHERVKDYFNSKLVVDRVTPICFVQLVAISPASAK